MVKILTNNPYNGFEDAFIRAVRKGIAKLPPEEKPWIDARPDAITCRNPEEKFQLTKFDVERAINALSTMPPVREETPFRAWGYYIFMTEWVENVVSEADCIAHYADNGSVVVYDKQGKLWHRGKQVTTADLLQVKRDYYPVGEEVLR